MVTPYASYDFALSIAGLAQQTDEPVSYVPQRTIKNLRVTSRRVDKVFHSKRPFFAPWRETRTPAVDGHYVNSYLKTFSFPGFLLELTGDVSINGSTVNDVELYSEDGSAPYTQLRLTGCCGSWYDYNCSDSNSLPQISIPGIWGFHSDYANAWLAVDVLTSPFITTTTQTTLTVADVDGADAYGNTPRISPGHLLKVDDEYMEVISTVTGTNSVTVIRGAHGSTAATHLIATPVSVWQVEEPVQWAVARQSDLMVARFGAYTTSETSDFGEIRYPPDWLGEVYAVMNHYAYR